MKGTDSIRLDGRVAVVSGAGRGLGRQFALQLAQRGAAVVVNDIGVSADAARYEGSLVGSESERDPYAPGVADAVAAEIVALGGRALASRANVAEPSEARTIVDVAIDAFGRIDIVVNNAGVIVTGHFSELTIADLQLALGVHLVGAFALTQSAWPHFVDNGCGRVINVGSVAGVLFGVNGHAAYDAAKGALFGLTRSLAAEGKPVGIAVNAILPTANTRSSSSITRPYDRGAGFEPEAVAPIVVWLSHEDCRESGRVFACGGGRVGEVYTAAARGYQSPSLSHISAEEIRDNWASVCSPAPACVPNDASEYNRFRRRILDEHSHSPSTGSPPEP